MAEAIDFARAPQVEVKKGKVKPLRDPVEEQRWDQIAETNLWPGTAGRGVGGLWVPGQALGGSNVAMPSVTFSNTGGASTSYSALALLKSEAASGGKEK